MEKTQSQTSGEVAHLAARNTFLDRVKRRLCIKGWTQCTNGGSKGPNCLNGALLWESALPYDRPTAYQAKCAIESALSHFPVITWNDIPGRSLDEVCALLDKAQLEPLQPLEE